MKSENTECLNLAQVMEGIGERVRHLRKNSGISQGDLAKEINVSRDVVARWESGAREMKTEHILKLARYFKVSCDKILFGAETENLNVYARTGLSDEATESLATHIKANSDIIKIANQLIANGSLLDICEEVKKEINKGLYITFDSGEPTLEKQRIGQFVWDTSDTDITKLEAEKQYQGYLAFKRMETLKGIITKTAGELRKELRYTNAKVREIYGMKENSSVQGDE